MEIVTMVLSLLGGIALFFVRYVFNGRWTKKA